MEIDTSSTEQMSSAITPIFTDDTKKAKYLSYRVANFSVMEACQLADCHIKSVRRWREDDPEFNAIDTSGMTHLRKKLSAEYLNIEFTRNFRLIMQKDFEVIFKSVTGKQLSEQEFAYLLKLRAHYTPQQFAMISQLLNGDTKEPFDYTKLTLTIKRERETMEIKTE